VKAYDAFSENVKKYLIANKYSEDFSNLVSRIVALVLYLSERFLNHILNPFVFSFYT